MRTSMNVGNLALIITLLTTATLGLFVISRDYKSKLNITFGSFSLAVAFWILTNLLANTASPSSVLFWNRIAIVGPAFLPILLVYFATIFPAQTKIWSKVIWFTLSLPTLGILLFTPTSYNIASVKITSDGQEIVFGSLYGFLFAYFGFYLFVALYNLYTSYKKSYGTQKLQLRYLFWSLTVSLLIGATTNLLLPLLNISSLVAFGALSPVIFVGFTSYAIVRHRLLDIEVIIRRSVIYSTLLASLTLIYTVLVFGFNQLFLPGIQDNGLRITDIIAIIIVAFTVDPLKQFIEKATDKFFFKARYNPEETLSEVSETLVSEIDLTHLVSEIKKVLRETIKVGKTTILVSSNQEYTPIKIANDFPEDLASAIEKKLLVSEHLKSYSEILVIDDLKSSLKEGKMLDHPFANWLEVLTKNGIQVVVPLLVKNQLRGLMLLGEKLSQDIYTGADIRFLEILSHQAALALENAKLYEEQRLYNIHLKEEVDRATKELKMANEKLRELDKLKDEFISVTSHDLRTPLTAIKSYLWLALHGKAGKLNEKMDFYLGRSYQSAERMLALISDLLDVSRIERGKIELHLEPADLMKVLEMILDELQSKAIEGDIKLSLAMPKTPLPEVMLDQERFPEIITNLVGNALKFTPKKGSVTVTATHIKDRVEVCVTDSGVGIGKEDMPKLFSKFGRLDNSYKAIATTGGTGLGLYITKNLVALHGGDITVLSSLGKGTTFTFSLKIATEGEKKQKKYIPAPQGVIINPELMGQFKTPDENPS